jgi:hypothetical protein
MIQETYNQGNRFTIRRKQGTALLYQQMTDTEEVDKAPMNFSPVLTNICISLLVMTLLAVCFRF